MLYALGQTLSVNILTVIQYGNRSIAQFDFKTQMKVMCCFANAIEVTENIRKIHEIFLYWKQSSVTRSSLSMKNTPILIQDSFRKHIIYYLAYGVKFNLIVNLQ